MSLQQLIEADCGGQNALVELSNHLAASTSLQNAALTQPAAGTTEEFDDRFSAELLGQVSGQPQSFQMNVLLQEMQNIGIGNAVSPQQQSSATQWSSAFLTQSTSTSVVTPAHNTDVHRVQSEIPIRAYESPHYDGLARLMPAAMPLMPVMLPAPQQQHSQAVTFEEFFNAAAGVEQKQPQQTVNDWVNEYVKTNEARENAASANYEDFWQRLQDDWQKLSESENYAWLWDQPDSVDAYKEYQFAEHNPMSHDVSNALEKGKVCLAKGDISSAVLFFEVAAQANPDSAEAWQLLGSTQAENERDPQSIAALKRALAIEPGHRTSLMSLAISYANENLHSQAVQTLIEWLKAHPTYKSLLSKHPELLEAGKAGTAASLMGYTLLDQVQRAYIEAVQSNPSVIDVELQEALGVLFNLSSDYDKAADCFRTALQVSPSDAKLWNRLGATLANGSHSVDAVDAYQRALSLQPGFIRVRYNIGVCCLNLKAYKQAVEHLLAALNMQSNANESLSDESLRDNVSSMSDSIWNTLKIILSLMGRPELQVHVTDKNLPALNAIFKE